MQIKSSIRWHFIIAFVVLLYAQNSLAKTIELKIIDSNGLPVPNAVVSVPSVSAQKQTQIKIMDQVDKQFLPYVLTTQKGQAVDFPNSDDIRHHVYSFSQPNQFEIKLFSGSEAQPIAFDNPGIVVLGCNIHDNMIAYIYVNDGELTFMTDNKGMAKIDLGDTSHSDELIELNIWHPDLSLIQTDRVKSKVSMNKTLHEIKLPFALQMETPTIETGFKKKFGS